MSLSEYFSDSDLHFFGQGKGVCACVWVYVERERESNQHTHNFYTDTKGIKTQ